ncbi:MAG TPA: cadherin-like domain-containing protein [Anaerolineae bacterium]|nr:cadherin-like domain-containing protein [Anaerolineae bacterium]
MANKQIPGLTSFTSYNSHTAADQQWQIPHTVRNLAGYNAQFSITNPNVAASAHLTVTFSGTNYTHTATLPPNNGTRVNLDTLTPLPNGYSGVATITANLPVVVTVQLDNADTGGSDFAAFNATPSAPANPNSPILYSANQFKDGATIWQSATSIANLATDTSTVAISWYDTNGLDYLDVDNIPSLSNLIISPSDTVPAGFAGSLVASSDQPMLGINQRFGTNTSLFDSAIYELVPPPASAADTYYLDIATINHDLSQGLTTEIAVQNMSNATAVVDITLYEADTNNTILITDNIPANTVKQYHTDDIEGLTATWAGAATVSADQPINVEITQFWDLIAELLVQDDTYHVAEDNTLTVAAPGVLSNDVDAQNDPLTTNLETVPPAGSLTFNTDGSFNYTPPLNFSGPISFTYSATDGTFTETGVVTIIVDAVNDPPTITPIMTQTIISGMTSPTLTFQLEDVDTAGADLVVTAEGADPTIIPHNNILIWGSDNTRYLTFTPISPIDTTTTLTLTVTDGDNTITTDIPVIITAHYTYLPIIIAP